ncbi:3-hydroxyacyl-CoA dehydrogenase NAD-binding domain-containing protein [Nocardia jinanensis]|uniref:Fatty acid degradation protein n=1 Tax=Nocardia jinanensis TaxID=382504 RepID=A0A917RMP6_9NOCA|nr:3-hydroxyacyl-CoA dehydrogenase NAD-binding domain-containing protein [Nocardia jinanensis]GGL14026.1 fatty acid degradation protein [Nocardia jinanensis]
MTTVDTEQVGGSAHPVEYRVDGRVAVLRIDNPPVNASTARVRAAIISGIARAANAEDITGIVLIGNERAFISGSDLTEFAEPLLPEPQLPEVIAAIEQCPKPVVAALSGMTLGGGLELALGCDARIAAPSAVVGLPEVSLGMIPGAGGTQRLPRLIGIAATIELVCTGTRLTAPQALDAGIVDELCATEEDLLGCALAHASRQETKRILARAPIRPDAVGSVEAAAAEAIRQIGARPRVVAAIGATMLAGAVPGSDALAFERGEFHRLRVGREAQALRHLFFAERAAGRDQRGGDASHINIVGVVGAGTMGIGIARAFLDTGLNVVLLEANRDALESGTQRLQQGYERAITRGQLDETAVRARLATLTTTMIYADLQPCDLIIEAVYEDMNVKQNVLRQVEEVVRADIPVATNTSYLDLDELAASTSDPGRIVGLHFFSPAHATKVLEVVHGTATSEATTATAVALARRMRKTPVVAGAGFGFIGNRIFNAYRQQCELMLEEGAYPRQVDDALEEFGFAMGPFTVADLSGLDIAWRMRQNTAAHRDPHVRYADIADLLCEQGRFGQKAQQGWYRYNAGSTQPLTDRAVEDLIDAESRRKGIARRPFTNREIVRRALLSMANEAALLLADGIAARPSDIDLMMTLGYGFPRHHGGPVFWAAHEDLDTLSAELQQLRQLTGSGYRAGDLTLLTAVPATSRAKAVR